MIFTQIKNLKIRMPSFVHQTRFVLRYRVNRRRQTDIFLVIRFGKHFIEKQLRLKSHTPNFIILIL